MRRDTIYSLVVGTIVGLIALGLHALTDHAAPRYQLLALVLCGAAIYAAHLALGLRRARKVRERAEHSDADLEPETFLRDRRNPFFRELTRDWTGLDEPAPAAPPDPKQATGEAQDDRSSDGADR